MPLRSFSSTTEENYFESRNVSIVGSKASYEKLRKDKEAGEFLYVEMAHYTDDDTLVLICITPSNHFEINEYKLEKLKDAQWRHIVDRFCSGNSTDKILHNVLTLFASLEFKKLVYRIYKLIISK